MPNHKDLPVDRVADILEHILHYCAQVSFIHNDFNCSKEKYDQSYTYRNAIAMCILQIGELVKYLPQTFVSTYTEIPWRQIRNTRNFVAHDYGSVDFEIVWDASTHGINELRDFCNRYLQEHESPR